MIARRQPLLSRLAFRDPFRFFHNVGAIACIWVILPSVVFAQFEVADVTRAIEANESALKSFALTARVSVTVPTSEGAGAYIAAKSEEKLLVLQTGEARCEISGVYLDGGPHQSKYVAIGVFDGAQMRLMKGSEHYTHGLASDDRNNLPWQLDPRQFTTHYLTGTVSGHIRTNGATLAPWEEDGELLHIVTDTIRRDIERRYEFVVDPNLGFAVVRRSISCRYPGNENWIEYGMIVCAGYSEQPEGIWLPAHAHYRTRNVSEKHANGRIEPPLLMEQDIHLSDWVVHPTYSSESFTLEFDDGIYVTDRLSGKNYQMAGISDDMIAAQVNMVNDEMANRNGHQTRLWLVIAVNILLVFAFLMFLLIRRLRASSLT